MKSKKIILNLSLIITSITLLSVNSCNPSKKEQFPNVIFILADDIGPGDITVYRQEREIHENIIPTPNLDKIAKNGMVFTDANTPAAVCAPTRYSIMTGNNSYRCRLPLGVWNPFDSLGSIKQGQKTVANVMKDAGYRTAFIGKWHLGGKWKKLAAGNSYPGSEIWDDGWDYSNIVGHNANTLGFDYSLSLPHGIQGIPLAFYENSEWMPLSKESFIKIWDKPSWNPYPDGPKLKSKGDSEWDVSLVGSILTNKAVQFIHNHLKNEKEKPFFMYYCSQAVHLPHDPPETFSGRAVKGQTPSLHGDMILELDLQIGRIIETLEVNGILENTLFIFTSDNGAILARETTSAGHDSSNGYRGWKGSIYEGGTRVPFMAMWPGVIPKGVITNEPVMAHDLMATLYALTGQVMPEDQGMDSYNILPVLINEPGAKGRDIKIYQSGSPWGKHPYNKMLAFRKGDYKLIIESDAKCSVGNKFAFFNLKDNPDETETKNLINEPSEQMRIEEMYNEYLELRRNNSRTTAPGEKN
jgi:arylsulfatase A-like enzyme